MGIAPWEISSKGAGICGILREGVLQADGSCCEARHHFRKEKIEEFKRTLERTGD
jgi:hypothetical protein